MGAVVVVCDRCGEQIRGLEVEGATAGFYRVDRGVWKYYARENEFVICDKCMWKDTRYQEDYQLAKNDHQETSSIS